MTEKRYYQKNYEEEYYIFDSKTLTEKEFEKKIEYDGYDLFAHSLTSKEVVDLLNENEKLKQENKTLKEENKHYKYILQDLGLLMSDEEVRDIRIEIADKIINPLCKENGFDVDVDCTNGFTIIPKR